MSDDANPYARIRAAVEAQKREPDRLAAVLAEIADLRCRVEAIERALMICHEPDCTVGPGNECPHGVLIGGIGAVIDTLEREGYP